MFFQNREASNRFYEATPSIVQRTMDRFAALTGRAHRLFEYHGAHDAQRVIVVMGSASETVRATVDAQGATIAQFYCELAEQSRARNALDEARQHIEEAYAAESDCVRASTKALLPP